MKNTTNVKPTLKPKNSFADIFPNSAPQHRFFPTGMVHNFYIYEEIQDVSDYVDYVTILDCASENDVINIFLNTPGGNLMAAISIIHAINRTQATVYAHADGDVASAGSLIFFATPNRVVNPYAQLMLHDASMFTGGKLSESIKGIHAMTELVSRMAHDIYFPYFNEDEIADILDGKDFYCNSQEICERVERGEAIIREIYEEYQREQSEGEQQPKKKAKKKK